MISSAFFLSFRLYALLFRLLRCGKPGPESVYLHSCGGAFFAHFIRNGGPGLGKTGGVSVCGVEVLQKIGKAGFGTHEQLRQEHGFGFKALAHHIQRGDYLAVHHFQRVHTGGHLCGKSTGFP